MAANIAIHKEPYIDTQSLGSYTEFFNWITDSSPTSWTSSGNDAETLKKQSPILFANHLYIPILKNPFSLKYLNKLYLQLQFSNSLGNLTTNIFTYEITQRDLVPVNHMNNVKFYVKIILDIETTKWINNNRNSSIFKGSAIFYGIDYNSQLMLFSEYISLNNSKYYFIDPNTHQFEMITFYGYVFTPAMFNSRQLTATKSDGVIKLRLAPLVSDNNAIACHYLFLRGQELERVLIFRVDKTKLSTTNPTLYENNTLSIDQLIIEYNKHNGSVDIIWDDSEYEKSYFEDTTITNTGNYQYYYRNKFKYTTELYKNDLSLYNSTNSQELTNMLSNYNNDIEDYFGYSSSEMNVGQTITNDSSETGQTNVEVEQNDIQNDDIIIDDSDVDNGKTKITANNPSGTSPTLNMKKLYNTTKSYSGYPDRSYTGPKTIKYRDLITKGDIFSEYYGQFLLSWNRNNQSPPSSFSLKVYYFIPKNEDISLDNNTLIEMPYNATHKKYMSSPINITQNLLQYGVYFVREIVIPENTTIGYSNVYRGPICCLCD